MTSGSMAEERAPVGSLPHAVPEPDWAAAAGAAARQRELTKPPGALGRLESLAVWMAARQKQVIPRAPTAAVIVYAADHGVAARGVSAYPSSVTAQMVAVIAAGRAAVSVFARALGVELRLIDIGVASDVSALNGVVHVKVRSGSSDLSSGPAMTRGEAQRALDVGREQAARAIDQGADLIIAGDIGIANTTAAAALLCALMDEPPARIVGRGTGVDDAGLRRKVEAVSAAVQRVRRRGVHDSLGLLAELGGLEIAAMTGSYLESARRGVPVILDGFISAAAAALAVSIAPGCREWLLASHVSAETGHRLALEWLRLEPILDLRLRLGEGTGALLALPILRLAVAMHAGMLTFDEAGVSRPP